MARLSAHRARTAIREGFVFNLRTALLPVKNVSDTPTVLANVAANGAPIRAPPRIRSVL